MASSARLGWRRRWRRCVPASASRSQIKRPWSWRASWSPRRRVRAAAKSSRSIPSTAPSCNAWLGAGRPSSRGSYSPRRAARAGRRPTELARLILTASGGPFRTWGAERVSRATVAEALKHPTWTMGKKVTVDSATLVNKALEVIEAHFLFTVPYEQVDVVIHPQSVIHGFVEFVDGSVLAQVGFPTMELPILYALTYPERVPDQGVRRFDPVAAGTLTFEAVQPDRFPAYVTGREAARVGGTAPARFNAANEVAVQLFLEERITFGRIAEIIARVTEDARHDGDANSLDAVLAADTEARRLARGAACS